MISNSFIILCKIIYELLKMSYLLCTHDVAVRILWVNLPTRPQRRDILTKGSGILKHTTHIEDFGSIPSG